LYTKYDVKRGLRDRGGAGVLCGLTEVSEVNGTRMIDGVKTEIEGELFYRGVNVRDLVNNCVNEDRFGFEETVYLLLFGKLPTASELKQFTELLAEMRELPQSFVRDMIMKAPSSDVMNMLARCVLNLYSYDETPDDLSMKNVLSQSLQLIAQFPLLAVYSHRAWKYYHAGSSLVIHHPVKEYSCAQNILHILRKNSRFTDLEAKTLDACLIMHAEHGGGNNSSFTTHVVTSSGTDTYSSVAASLGSLKGPKHGGANMKVSLMFENIKEHLGKNWTKEKLQNYLYKILRKEAFDKSGLIYGIGHAVYTKSDPRCQLLKDFAGKLSVEKGMEKDFELYNSVAEIAKELVPEIHKNQKSVSPNVDFYSGFVYTMLNLPKDLYTPMFAVARIAGWSAHRMEELTNGNKIIRPAYACVKPRQTYVPITERK
ncbi:MAG: citrate/2-methylcitrate synthase, partial [Clostridia bacterium]|nr:citrate/2-methylcitrate synthase [Clostridia bacterium]